jgi:hypothetical protein
MVSVVSVSVSTNVLEAQCKVYIGTGVGQATFVDGTLSGSSGDSTDRVAHALYPGQIIFAVWTGGDIGSTATVNVVGTRQVP